MNLQDFFENIDRAQQRVKQLPADFRPPQTSPQLAGPYPGQNATRGYLVGEGQGLSDNPMAQAVTRRIMNQHPEWLQRYGVEAVMQVIDDVTAGEEDWEEIGSSDVSAYVNMVGDRLADSAGSREEMRDRRPFAEQGVAEAVDPGRRRILAGMLGLAAQSIVPRSVASALAQELSAASVADDVLERAALSLLNAIRWRLKQFEDDDYEGDGYGDEVRKIAGKLGMSPDQFEELMELYEYGSDPDDAAEELLRHLQNVDPRTIIVKDRDFDDDDDNDDVVNPSTISKVANQAQTAAAAANQAQTAAATAASFRNLLQRMMSRYLITAPPREKYMGRIEPTSSAPALPAPDKTAAEIMRDLQDLMDRPLTNDEKEVVRQEIRTAQNKGVLETSDYFRRREREEAIISGQKPARKKQPAQTSDYARRREQAKKKEQGVREGSDMAEAKGKLTYTPKPTEYGVFPDSKKEFGKIFQSKDQAQAHIEKFGGKLVVLDQHGRRIKGVSEGSTSKKNQKTPYRDINSPEYRAAADRQKQQMAKDKAAEPGKKLLGKIEKKGVAEGSKEKTPGVALSKAYKKDFDGNKPGHNKPETALTGTYSKTGKPGGELKKKGVSEGYTGRETKDGTWRVFKDGEAVSVAGPFKSREEATAWIKKQKQSVQEATGDREFDQMMGNIVKKKLAVDRRTGKEYDPDEELDKLLQQHQAQFQGMAAIEKAQKKDVQEAGLAEIQQRLSQQFAAEDVLGGVRQRLGDMIQAKAQQRARQMQRRRPPEDVLGEPVRRIEIAPGRVLEIHGNEDDGFRIHMSKRSMPTRFASLGEAEMATEMFLRLNESKKDACYHKVKSRVKIWPSAYASGQLVQCRKRGADNWGTGGKKK